MDNSSIKIAGIITKRSGEQHKELVMEITQYFQGKGIQVIYDSNCSHFLPKTRGYKKTELLAKADLALVLGGDGTILKTARRLPRKKTLILGVNVGNLGFLSECTPQTLFPTLDKVLKGKCYIDERSLLRVTVYRDGGKSDTYLALNDAVINQGAFARLIEIHLEVDGRKVVNIKADGIIVATPTGSTAHSLSAGGPIVHPSINSLTVSPICPSSLSIRPIVIPDDKQLTATIKTQRREKSAIIGLTIDGQDLKVLHYGDKVKFRRSSRNIYFVRTTNRYYRILRDKIHWGEL